MSYVDPRRATHERVYEQAIEGHLFGGEMETAGWDALLKKNENFKISVKDIDFFVVSLRIFVWFLRGTVRSDG